MTLQQQKQYHTQTALGDVGRYVLMPGDPGRVPIIAARLENPRHIATNREYVTYTGTLEGTLVSVTSTGIGIVQSMRRAVTRLGLRHQVGISHSKDSYYGEVEPERSALPEELADLWRAWTIGGAICSEMELSTICIVSSILGARAGGIMAMHGEGEFGPLDSLIDAAVESVRELIRFDLKDNSVDK